MRTTLGALAQLGAHHTGSVGVTGSSPVCSTKFFRSKTTKEGRHFVKRLSPFGFVNSWTDVDLSAKGVSEASAAGKVMTEAGFKFDMAFTSYLLRANHTLALALESMGQSDIPVKRSWELNERHYGGLQGLNKSETAEKYG